MTPPAASPVRAHLHLVEPSPPALVERAVELDVLDRALERLRAGEGAAVVLDAAAGLGKTALLEHAARSAAEAGYAVRRAAPGPLERDFPFGLLRGLFDGEVVREDSAAEIASKVLWLSSALAFVRPLALIVDDAQWADRESLEVLNYLARRIADVPVLLVVAARGGDPDAAGDLLSLLASSGTLLAPAPLSPAGAVTLIRRLAPDTSYQRGVELHRAATGNPWLLGALVQGSVEVGTRMAPLSPRDRAVACALAVIGDEREPHVVASAAGVELGELAPARDALLAAGLLGSDGARFAHPLIARAIADGLPRSERARLHRHAARALLADGAADSVVVEHVLHSAPSGDAELSGVLVRTAAEAADRGALHTATELVQRALEERAPGDDRGRMLSMLGSLAFDAGQPDSRARLREALRAARDRDSRVDVLTRLATLQALDSGDAELASLLRDEFEREHDPQVRAAVEAAALDALMMVPDRHEERALRAAAIDLDAVTDPSLRCAVLAHRAWADLERGESSADTCVAMALEALEGDHLLRDATKRAGYHLCVRTLIFADRLHEARAAIARLCAEAKGRGSLLSRAAASWHSAELARRAGRVADAEAQARMVLELVEDGMNVLAGGAIDILVWALAERGAFDEARALLGAHGLDGPLGGVVWEIGVVHARARLRLAEGDFERARADACEVGKLRGEQGRSNPTWTMWGSTAALALAHLGRREEAAAVADAELERALAFGAPVPIASALHARAVAEPDDSERLALLQRALEEAGNGPESLESVRARLELGSTLARMGRRVEARGALRPALAGAHAAGAVLLAERARRELVATGLRPRQAALSGPESLTPRQRQICHLAAAGKSNRAIAQELFLSIKTVETHLATAFRKLDVGSRDDLRAELAA